MKKIVFLLFMSFAVYSVNAQTCTPDFVIDNMTMTSSGNQITFHWNLPSGGTGGPPPPPPGTITYNIAIEYGTTGRTGVAWAYAIEKFYDYTLFTPDPQMISTVVNYPAATHARIYLQVVKDDGSCENSWSAPFEFTL